MKRNLLIAGGLVTAILLIDQIVKVYVKTHFMPNEIYPVFGNWFKLLYVENQGMAFGTTFGSAVWGKLGLSLFRIVAITGIGIYWYQQAKKGAKRELLAALALIFAGAFGNLIDSMLYDFVFNYDPCMIFNRLDGSGIWSECGYGKVETRQTGFLFGNVVDMFHFDATWPKWVPVIGGNAVFPAIWNVADASITIGVLMMLFRQKAYFKKKPKAARETRDVQTEPVQSAEAEV